MLVRPQANGAPSGKLLGQLDWGDVVGVSCSLVPFPESLAAMALWGGGGRGERVAGPTVQS